MALTQTEIDFLFAGQHKEEQPKTLEQKLESLGALIEQEQAERVRRDYPKLFELGMTPKVKIVPGRRYTKIDVGDSGKYMVENETQQVFGIKGYGVIHRGYRFGTLDEMLLWDWSGYRAFKK